MRSILATIMITLAGMSSATAQPADSDYTASVSEQRLKQIAALPDWSGLWRVNGSIGLISATEPPIFRRGNRNTAPYRPEWEARYEEMAIRAEDQGNMQSEHPVVDSHTVYCAAGVPRLVATPFDYMFVVQPEMTLINVSGEVRIIYTDGRSFPPADEMWPRFYAWSIGHWEDDTLVVETRGMKAGLWLDTTPFTLSEQASMIERIRRTGPDVIENQVTITDPVAFTEPWSFTRTYGRVDSDLWMIEKELCGGPEDRNPIVNGRVTVILQDEQ